MARFITATLLLATVAYYLQITAGAPQMSGPTATMDSLTRGTQKCEKLSLSTPGHKPHYCETFGYRTSLFPGPRHTVSGQSYPEWSVGQFRNDARREVDHFAALMDTECSRKLGTLLCFLYFPFCSDNGGKSRPMISLPCRSICEEVTAADSNCTRNIAAMAGLEWGPHFNCNATFIPRYLEDDTPIPIFPEDEGQQCANADQVPWEVTPKTLPPPVSTRPLPVSTKPSPVPTKPTKPGGGIREPPTEEEPATDTEETDQTPDETTTAIEETCLPECIDEPCPSKFNCKIRRQTNTKTFVRNDYNVAFKGKFNAFTTLGCKHALNFTLLEAFPIKQQDAETGECSEAPSVDVGSTILTLGRKSVCKNCFKHTENLNLETGSTYFVAGHYERKSNGCVLWHLGSRTVIEVWSDRRHTPRRMRNVINKGNNDRGC